MSNGKDYICWHTEKHKEWQVHIAMVAQNLEQQLKLLRRCFSYCNKNVIVLFVLNLSWNAFALIIILFNILTTFCAIEIIFLDLED